MNTTARRALFSILIAAFFIAAASPLSAEGIFLTDGRVIYGRILSQGDSQMQVRTSYGIIPLKKSDIKKIDYDLGLGQVTAVLKNGNLVSGTLISLTATKVIVKESSIDHDIPRAEIENLVLSKFEGRRDNIFGLTGGITRTMNTVREQAPYGYVDISAFYLRSTPSLPFLQWGLSASYIRLATKSSETKLKDAELTICPALAALRLRYPLISLVTNAAWAANTGFFAELGAGTSYVTLSEKNENRTGSYFTAQPSFGVSFCAAERVYIESRCDWLYVHQAKLSYTGLRARIGAGYIF